jgi:hypothetical protein
MGEALFKRRIRTVYELASRQTQEPVVLKKRYRIVRTVELNGLCFREFSINLLSPRDFIMESASDMVPEQDGTWPCLLVRERGARSGVLVHSDGKEYARYTALFNGV